VPCRIVGRYSNISSKIHISRQDSKDVKIPLRAAHVAGLDGAVCQIAVDEDFVQSLFESTCMYTFQKSPSSSKLEISVHLLDWNALQTCRARSSSFSFRIGSTCSALIDATKTNKIIRAVDLICTRMYANQKFPTLLIMDFDQNQNSKQL
jgi:hypothetical protein